MKNRKIFASLIAVLMMVTMLSTQTAEAAVGPNKRSVKITAKCVLPKTAISVTVPGSTRRYVNPSKISIRTTNNITVDGQIISLPYYIENKSEVPVSVSVSVKGTVKTGSKMTLSGSGESSSKEADVRFEMVKTSKPESPSWESSSWSGVDVSIPVTTTAQSEEDVMVLDQVDKRDRYAVFHLAGDCTPDPDPAWKTTDGFYTDIVFTFKQLVRESD